MTLIHTLSLCLLLSFHAHANVNCRAASKSKLNQTLAEMESEMALYTLRLSIIDHREKFSQMTKEDLDTLKRTLVSIKKPDGVGVTVFKDVLEIDRQYSDRPKERQDLLEKFFMSNLESLNYLEALMIINNMEYFGPPFGLLSYHSKYSKIYFQAHKDKLTPEQAIELASKLSEYNVTWNAKFNRTIEDYFNQNLGRLTQNDVNTLIASLRMTNITILVPLIAGVSFDIPQNVSLNSPSQVKARILEKWHTLETIRR